MIRLVRVVWFVSCPLLAVSATVHVPLERVAAAEIEHYVDIAARHRGSTAHTPDCNIPTNAAGSPGHASLGYVWDAWGSWKASGPVCIDTRTAAARAVTTPKTVRLLI